MRIELTTPDNRRFEVNPAKIDILVEAIPGLYAPEVKTVIYAAGLAQGVCETIEHIKELENEKIPLHSSHQPSRQTA